MGIDDPGLWTTVLIGVTGLGTAIFRLIQAKIQADRDTRIAAMAFRGTKPHERPEILDGLAKLRSFHPDAARPCPALTTPQASPKPSVESAGDPSCSAYPYASLGPAPLEG